MNKPSSVLDHSLKCLASFFFIFVEAQCIYCPLEGIVPGKGERDLDAVVDEPLQSGERADHDDPGAESLPASLESQGLGRRADRRPLRLVHVAHDGVGGVRDDGAEHARDVASRERHDQLLALKNSFDEYKFGKEIKSFVRFGQSRSILQVGQ